MDRATRNGEEFRYIFERMDDALLWLLFEAGVALLLLIAIVWWTWPRAPRERKPDDRDNS